MNSQNNLPELLEGKDYTVPLILTGLFVGYACICICICVSMIVIWQYSPPVMELLEPIPTSTPVPISCPAIPVDWAEVTNDKFGPNVNMWPLGKYTDSYADTNMEIKNGALTLSLKAHQDFYGYYTPNFLSSRRNFYLLTNVRQKDGSLKNDYGVTFRSKGWNHYYFAINNAGEVLIYKHIDNEQRSWENLYRTTSSSVLPGAYNELIVFAQEEHFIFCVNQQVVADINDDSYINGYTGIGMGLEQSNDAVIIEYDNFVIYGPAE